MTDKDYRVHLDGTKGGIKPFLASNDPTESYEYMREFSAWAIDNPSSKASTDLKVRLVKFYSDLRNAYDKYGDKLSLDNLPSYDSYLELVDAYNEERGYTSPLRAQADNQSDSGSSTPTGSSHDDRPAWVDELIGAIKAGNSRPVRPTWRDRLATAKAAGTTSLHDLVHPEATNPETQPQRAPRPNNRTKR